MSNKKTTNKQRRDAKIYKQFVQLRSVKKHGVAKYSFAYMVKELADKWCLEPITIEQIISSQKKLNNNE